MSVLSIFQLILALLNQIAPMLIPILTHPTGAGTSHLTSADPVASGSHFYVTVDRGPVHVRLTAAEAALLKDLLAHATVEP